MDIFEKNCSLIDKRIARGLEILRASYEVVEVDMPECFKRLTIQNMDFEITQYDVRGVGNLVTMKCKSAAMQMDTFTLTPYEKNLPLFTTDYIYNGETRIYLNEIYDLCVRHDEIYDRYIAEFMANKEKHSALPDMPTKPCWYDGIRPVCTSKKTDTSADEENLSIFYDNLDTFIRMEKECDKLGEADRAEKWRLNKDYADRLVDEGGVSTDVFKATLGSDDTHRFFNEVFFGPDKNK